MLKSILHPKSTLVSVVNAFNNKYRKGNFAKRIKRRHDAFWKSADAETIRNKQMWAHQSIAEWKQGTHWQRKLSNKFNAREFAIKHDCRVPNLYWKGRNTETIDFDKLPSHYVIRPTIGHSCNLVFLMAAGINMMDKNIYTPENIKALLDETLAQNPHLEFLIEEFIRTENGEYKIPDDYKFYMFNGEIARILIINRLSSKEAFMTYYDQDWNRIENISYKYPPGVYQPPPYCLNEMKEYAKRLSKAYEIFARIDFYATDKGAVFGEFTPTPSIGKGLTPQGDKLLDSYWDKFCKGKI